MDGASGVNDLTRHSLDIITFADGLASADLLDFVQSHRSGCARDRLSQRAPAFRFDSLLLPLSHRFRYLTIGRIARPDLYSLSLTLLLPLG